MNYNSYHTIGKIGIIIGIIFRIFYLPKSIDLNLVDTIFHIKKIMTTHILTIYHSKIGKTILSLKAHIVKHQMFHMDFAEQ